MVAFYHDNVAEALGQAPEAQRHVKSLRGRGWCFYQEEPLSDGRNDRPGMPWYRCWKPDVFKVTVLGLHNAFQAEDLPVKMVLLLHDGIWFTCPLESATVARVKEAIKKIMENSVRFSVQLKVEVI